MTIGFPTVIHISIPRLILRAVQIDASYFNPFPRKVRFYHVIGNFQQSRDLLKASIQTERSIDYAKSANRWWLACS